jgi:hypothetical protein
LLVDLESSILQKWELADKPDSVKFVRKQTATIIHLGQQSLTGSSNTPDFNYIVATVLMVNL